MKKVFLIVFVALVVFLSASCATILRSDSEREVSIDSTPSGATVTIDGEVVGVTPLTISLDVNKKSYSVKLQEEGYPVRYFTIKRKISGGWLLADLLLTTVIGVAVDMKSGAIFDLESLDVDLKENPTPQRKKPPEPPLPPPKK